MDAILKKVNSLNRILREAEIYLIRAYRGKTTIRFRENGFVALKPVSKKFALKHLELCANASKTKEEAANKIRRLLRK